MRAIRTIWLASLLLWLWAAVLQAEDVQVVPQVTVQEEYNDNLDLSSDSRKDDFITTVSPGLTFSRITERSSWSLAADLDWVTYQEHSERDNLDRGFRLSGRYQLAPLTSVNAGGAYTQDSRSDRDIEDTGLVSAGFIRTIYSLNAGATRRFTEGLAASISYGHSRQDYDIAGDPDSSSHRVGLQFQYNLERYLPRSQLLANVSYSRDEDTRSESDTLRGTAGLRVHFSDHLTMSVNAGARRSRTTYDSFEFNPFVFPFFLPIKVTSENTGLIGSAEVRYALLERTSLTLTYDHDVEQSDDRSGLIERRRLAAGVSHRLAERWKTSVYASCNDNTSDTTSLSDADVDEWSFSITPRLRYEINRHLALEANYRYAMQRDRISDRSARQNRVLVSVSGNYPLFE